MADEVQFIQSEIPVVESIDPAAVRPQPTAEEQLAADAVFSRDQNEVAASLLAAQVGLGVLHNLVIETFQRSEEREQPKRKDKERPEDEDR